MGVHDKHGAASRSRSSQNSKQVEEKGEVNTKRLGLVWGKMVVRGVSVIGCFLLSANRVISFYSALVVPFFFGTWWVSSYVALRTLPHFY